MQFDDNLKIIQRNVNIKFMISYICITAFNTFIDRFTRETDSFIQTHENFTVRLKSIRLITTNKG